jgi:hypothetical protein
VVRTVAVVPLASTVISGMRQSPTTIAGLSSSDACARAGEESDEIEKIIK